MLAVLLMGGAGSCVDRPEATAIAAPARADLQQGWNQKQRDWWYEGTQGSRLLPAAWARALEAPTGTEPFFARARMAAYRYLPPEPTSRTGLPIGFALDDSDDTHLTHTNLRWVTGQGPREKWLGMNCSACHTGQITYQGKTLRVDGGPTLADMQTFIEDLDASLSATRTDPAKFARFTAAVLKAQDTPPNRVLLAAALDRLIAWEGAAARMNATPLRYGHARLDAFGRIYTKIALFAGATDPTINPADAPVSYPFLWNTHQADKVQWNGIASNKQLTAAGTFDYGALGRNIGEVSGVFGDVNVMRTPGLAGYHSSVQVQSIEALERLLATLKPPAWPAAVFGAPDVAAAAQGKVLFGARCASCHEPLARDDLAKKFNVKMSLFEPGLSGNTPPGTDPWMACNAYTYEAKAGNFEGTKRRQIDGEPIGATEPVATLLSTSVIGTILGQKGATIATAATTFLGFNLPPRVVTETVVRQTRQQRLNRCLTANSDILGYKARPLTGIWATAPYLHNGSVPTLYDVLLPPAQRPRSFAVGTREYDPVRVGYVSTASADSPFTLAVDGPDGQPLPGNSNAGHDYGNAAFTAADRRALVEYMKTL